jgi:hypothetical protein
MKVILFDETYRQDFIDMNRAWISEMFHKWRSRMKRNLKISMSI